MSGSSDSFFKGFLFGSIIGTVVGVLVAPKSGREMREDLGEEAEKIFENTKVDLENARKAAIKSFEEGRDRIIEKMKTAKSDVVEETEDVQEASIEEEKPERKGRRSRTKRSS